MARSQRRLELQKTVRDALQTMNDREIFITHDDPLVQSLSVYALLLGYPFAADYISPFIALLLPLMIEVGSTFGLVMTRTDTRTLSPAVVPASGGGATKCPTDWTPPDTPNPWLSGQEMASQMIEVSKQRPWGCQGADSCAQIKLLQAVSERGGVLVGGQRSIADAIGIPKSTVHQALKALEKAGFVKVLATTKGTVVELVRGNPAPDGAPA